MNTDADDTTVSVSMTTDDWLPIAAVVVVCCILACVAVRCFAEPTGTTRTVCQGGALLLVVVALLVIIVTIYRRSSSSSSNGDSDACSAGCDEAFSNYEWGNDGFALKNATVSDAQRIVGPKPTDKEANTWQYNPQNTLVDYRFYTTEPEPERVAPVTHPSLGVRDLPEVDVNDRLGETSTRHPDANGTQGKYVLQHPASLAAFPYPTTQYVY